MKYNKQKIINTILKDLRRIRQLNGWCTETENDFIEIWVEGFWKKINS